MSSNSKIFFIINNLNLKGGAEVAIKRISSKNKGKLIDLESIGANSRFIFKDLFFLYFNLKRHSTINVFLEYSTILVLILKVVGFPIKVNVWFRTSIHHRFGRINEFLYSKLIKFSDKLIFQNKCQKIQYVNNYPSLEKISFKIYEDERIYPKVRIPKVKKNTFMFAGRLTKEKGILEIIDWCIKNNKKLLIYGYGSLENKIKIISSENDNINYFGPYKSFFSLGEYGTLIFNSLYEGTPNIIYEAIHLKIPIICRLYDDCVQDEFDSYNKITFFNDINEI